MYRRASLALALALSACNNQGAGTGGEAGTGPVAQPSYIGADAWTLGAIASLGERAAFVLVVRPDRGPALAQRLTGLAVGTFLADELAAIDDPARWLPRLLGHLRSDTSRPTPPKLDLTGLDRTRPIVAAFGDVALVAPTGVLAASLELHADRVPDVRHEIILPASDPAALLRSLVPGLSTLGEPRPANIAGASTWTLGARDTLALIPGDGLVRLVLVTGPAVPRDAPPDLSQRPAARATPGVAALAQDDAAVLFRPHRLPALTTVTSAQTSLDALATVDPAQRSSLRSAVLRELVICESVWGAEPLEFDDYALTLAADDHGLHARAVASLTARGSAAIDAATRAAGLPLSLVRPAAATAWSRFDSVAASASAGAPLSPLRSEDALDAVGACGSVFAMYSPTAPFASLARLQAGMLGPGAKLPSSGTPVGQLAIFDAAARTGGMAVLTDPNAPPANIENSFRNLADLLGTTLDITITPEGEHQRARAGFNLKHADVFAAPAPHDGIAHMRADLSAIRPLLALAGPTLAQPLAPYDRLTGAVRRSGRTLVADLSLTTGEPIARPLEFAGTTWDPPPPPAQPRCAQEFAGALSRTLRALHREHVVDSLDDPTPALSVDDALATLTALEPTLTCLGSDPSVDPARLRSTAAFAFADNLRDRHRPADAARILAAACTAGSADACARNMSALPIPTLPLVDTTCQDRVDEPSRLLTITSTTTILDDTPITPESLRAALTPPPRSLGLAIDETVPYTTLRPYLDILTDVAATSPELRLSFIARTTTDHDPLPLPLAAPSRTAPAPSTDPLAGFIHTITLTGDTARLQPENTAPLTPISGPVHVAPDDASSWRAVAGALARSCDGATLIPRQSSTTPPVVAPSQPTTGTLDKDIIRRIVRLHIHEVRTCYNKTLARDPKARGRVSVQFTITGTGKVASATIQDSSMADPEIAECIAAAARRWVFPKPEGGGSVIVTYPFVLEPG